MHNATTNPHHLTLASRHFPKWGLLDASFDQKTIDSSIEVNISHAGLADSASPLTALSIRSLNGYATTTTSADLLGAPSKNLHPPVKPQNGSFSRAYSATLSKFSSAKLGIASNKLSSRSIISMSKALSTGGSKLRKRPCLPDFNPPHCEKRVFEDGLVVQMIGSTVPPIVQMEGYLRRMTSFPPVERSVPLLDVEFSLDETSFGFNRSITASTLHIQVRSPSMEILERSEITTPVNGSLQTIYHSMDSVTILGNRSKLTGNSNASPFLSPFESNSQVNANHRPSPRLSASLMPHLSPIVLSELAALGEPEADDTLDAPTTPVTPSFSPVFTSDAESMATSPVITPFCSSPDQNVQSDMSEVFDSIDTGTEFTFNRNTEGGDTQTALNHDLGDISFPSIASSNQSRFVDKGRRWDTLYPSPSELATVDALDDQLPGPLRQQQSVSSSSVLAPLTQADFDATFEEVFRVGFTGSHANDDQTTPKRRSSTNPQLMNRNLLAFMHGQGTSLKA